MPLSFKRPEDNLVEVTFRIDEDSDIFVLYEGIMVGYFCGVTGTFSTVDLNVDEVELLTKKQIKIKGLRILVNE